MKDKIKELNEKIENLRIKTDEELIKLKTERDKLIIEQNPPSLNPYIKVVDLDENELVFKIVTPNQDYYTGKILGYYGKIITYNGTPYYHNQYYLDFSGVKKWEFISEVEFEELLAK